MLLTNIILRNLFAWEIEFSCEHEIPVCKTKLLHSDKKTDETPWYCVVSSHGLTLSSTPAPWKRPSMLTESKNWRLSPEAYI